MDSIRNKLLYSAYGIGGVDRLYDSPLDGSVSNCDPTAFDIRESINQGAFLINYIGLSSQQYPWETGSFTTNDIGLLQNDNKLPFVYSTGDGGTDIVGNYLGSTPCFAEKWLTAKDSSNGAATGAIGFYGSSSDPFWIESIWGEIAFNHMLVYGTASSFGQLCYSSSISMLNQIDESDKYLILFWNYLGDPSLAIIPNIFEAVDY